MRVLGAAYAAHRLGGVAIGAAKRPINAYRANSMERSMGREEATRDLAYGELESQELDAAGRVHENGKERTASYQRNMEKSDQRLGELKQNPDYKAYTSWRTSKAAHDSLAEPVRRTAVPPEEPDSDVLLRGRRIADQVSRLQQGRNVLKDHHSDASSLVQRGERNLREHGQLLSPSEVQNRVEGRRANLAETKSDPHAWKRPENLALADGGGKLMTPDRLGQLEKRAPSDPAARRELEVTKNQVSERMQASERLLTGVPIRNRFDRNVPASNPAQAASVLHDRGKRSELDAEANRRRGELRTHRRRTRLYRAAGR
jgi:hypothetical protein